MMQFSACAGAVRHYIGVMWLPLFILLPAVELFLLIEIGSHIGTLNTILLIVGTGALGWSLIKYQGMSTMHRIRGQLGQGEVPAVEVVSGLVLLGSALLLLTPGFITDSVGFAMLVPPLRRLVAARLVVRYKTRVVKRGEMPRIF